ncbi:bcl-2-related ovarian killer protein-like [Anopheles darlingi]|uniref:bcl-2-related ovarian killer protein-like n=1 Tax=Anopheles darlingi TaxID=43151 RepID=UPI00210024B5|nr:bcl-2-related ovarian killer protein-like [Anopheles darlingi]XP_049540247.1 bcl-2-related ovarian killer protein-like [Anopheles darlingi]
MSSTSRGVPSSVTSSPIVAAAVAAAAAAITPKRSSSNPPHHHHHHQMLHLTTSQDVIQQGKRLCGEYIRARLKRSGLLNRKILQRLRNSIVPDGASAGIGSVGGGSGMMLIAGGGGAVVREAFPILHGMGIELERMHPRLYTNVSRQISNEPWGELTEPDTVGYLLHIVAKDLFKTGVTWGKVISLFAIAGGLAVDCVRQDHTDYLQQLIEGTTDVIEEDLAGWLVERGGWLGLQDHVYPQPAEITLTGWLTITIITLALLYLVSLFLKLIGSNYLNSEPTVAAAAVGSTIGSASSSS